MFAAAPAGAVARKGMSMELRMRAAGSISAPLASRSRQG
jgi:hypothetical protein